MTQSEQTASSACPDCHALVEDLDAHERWHVRLTSDLAKAMRAATAPPRVASAD